MCSQFWDVALYITEVDDQCNEMETEMSTADNHELLDLVANKIELAVP